MQVFVTFGTSLFDDNMHNRLGHTLLAWFVEWSLYRHWLIESKVHRISVKVVSYLTTSLNIEGRG